MKNTAAVIFPDTKPSEDILIPLVLVFEPVVYIQPVENDDTGEPIDQLCRSMVDSSLCTLHVPAPLNENWDRFVKLVRDLQTRRDDYAAQLAHVSLAGISSASRNEEDTGSSIIGNLMAKHGIAQENQKMIEKLLWQARLILKLGEQHDADQKKMAAEMGKIQAREGELFSGMVNDDDSPFALTSKLSSLTPDTDRMLRLRRKAWARLFAFSSSPVSSRIFISPDTDAVDLLCEEFERQNGFLPDMIAKIPLPGRPGSEDYFANLQKFKSDVSDELHSIISKVKSPPLPDELHTRWETSLKDIFPAAEHDRRQLFLYRFADVRIKQLFLDSFGHDEDELETTLNQEDKKDIIIGALVTEDKNM